MEQEQPRLSWHSLRPSNVASELDVDPARGLSEGEVARRRMAHGRNALPDPPRPSAFIRIAAQFADPLVGALLVAAVIAAAVAASEGSSYADAIAILLIVLLNAALGYYQEARAEEALSALRKMAAPRAKVVRDGEVREVDASELVPGDVIELEAGDSVPADARLVRTAELAVEEAALTGESVPVDKRHDAEIDEEASVAERTSMVFTGTTATRGKARAIVVATGVSTELGRIGDLISRAGREPTPLETRLARLGRWILVACLLISAALFLIGVLRGSGSVSLLLLTAVSLAVAAIPEGLPAITTITLALGMQRMARRGAIVRKLPAVETLGSATIICTDKTGTLTQNAMTVRRIETFDALYAVSGEGFDRRGEIEDENGDCLTTLPEPARRLVLAGVICNDASLEEANGSRRVIGDPTEGALLVLGEKAHMMRSKVMPDYEVEREYPFDSDRKRMSVVVQRDDGKRLSFVKGSPDALLERCTRVLTRDGVRELDKEGRARLHERNEAHADEALRVLALAEREDPDDDPESNLTFLGFVAMLDPPRAEAREAVAECTRAGILVTMITGDHKNTAVAIAKDLGIWRDDAVALTGADLAKKSPDELDEVVERTRVFARVTAEQKLRIVESLQRKGHIVSMTGDGVNDAPALKKAPIGVAMGRSGTDVARQSAEMVLADDNFATIVHAVREGRAIYANIQKFIFFLGSSNAGLIIPVITISFLDGIPQLTPLQLLWINLVTNGMPALALGVDPAEPGQMNRGPRPPDQGIVGMRDLLGVLLVGAIMGGAALYLYMLPDLAPQIFRELTPEGRMLEARTMAFTLLALSPLFHAFNCRSPHESIFAVGWVSNRFLWLAIVISGSVHLVTILVPPLREVFHTHWLSAEQWLIIVALSFAPLPIVEALKAIERGFTRRRHAR